MHKLNRTIGSIVGACIVAASAAAWAGSAQFTAKAVPGPIYNETSKSYFELRFDGGIVDGTWDNVVDFATRRSYRGARGRLAIIDDRETMEFIQKTFKLHQAAWIGLRLFCMNRKLVWVNGDTHERYMYSAWHNKWHRTYVRCGNQNIDFMPVYLLPTPGGYRRQAAGPAKGFKAYLVEYPTGKP